MEYILYCDESSDEGPKCGDFFGGCLINSEDYDQIVNALETKKRELNLFGEIKWTKVTERYLDKYIEMMELFFSYVKEGKIRVRIMFRNIGDVPSMRYQHRDEEKYFKLYYQFIKHAFGFRYMPASEEPIYVRVYLDQLPDKATKCSAFKQYIQGIPNIKEFQDNVPMFRIREGDVAEVSSHEHVLLQCTDIVLGSMYFRLNDLHKAVPNGAHRRGKRTIAKEALYKFIHRQICLILPNFNIGISTGFREYENAAWEMPYRHWKFIPK